MTADPIYHGCRKTGSITLKDVVSFLGEILGFLALSAFGASAALALSLWMNGAG